jgi:hypothetical protein
MAMQVGRRNSITSDIQQTIDVNSHTRCQRAVSTVAGSHCLAGCNKAFQITLVRVRVTNGHVPILGNAKAIPCSAACLGL